MKKVFLIFFILIGFFTPPFVFSETVEEQYLAKTKEIEELEKKLIDLEKQEKTLSSQISLMNNQVKLTTLKITQTEEDISILSQKISRLEVSLDSLAGILGKRIAATYKKGTIDTLSLFFSSKGFSEFITRFKYLKVMQAHDRKLLFSMEETRTNYDEQRIEIEKLKVKLETQKKLLAQQKKDKEYLLGVTRSDEKAYREILVRTRAEQAAIERILAGQGDMAKVGPVSTGDKIGSFILGASVCSSGSHLHFEVVDGTDVKNPLSYLKSISLTDDSGGDPHDASGNWDWPLYDPIKFNQGFGSNTSAIRSRAVWYSFHSGIDIFSDNNSVKSVRQGTLYRGSISCGGGTLKYARVDHGDNLQTYYLHLN